ncbi:MAG TPA: hypothetical protein VGN16_20600, partial [Acidobacteriaceae bacterium]
LHCGGQPRDKRAPTPRRGPDGHPAHGYGIHVRNAGTYTDTRDLLLPRPCICSTTGDDGPEAWAGAQKQVSPLRVTMKL